MYYSNGERSEYGSSVSLPIKRRNSSLWTRPIQALVRQLTAHSIPSTNSTPSPTTAPAAGAQFQPGYMTKRRSAEFAEICQTEVTCVNRKLALRLGSGGSEDAVLLELSRKDRKASFLIYVRYLPLYLLYLGISVHSLLGIRAPPGFGRPGSS